MFKSEVTILSNNENASITYLLAPYLAMQKQLAVCIDANLAPVAEIARCGCNTVIIARYLPKHWVKPLQRFRSDGGRIIYFMDDDLMDPAVIVGLPAGYAKRILTLATRQRSVLESMCTEFWVASPYLAEKYHAWSPKLVSARPGLAQVFQTTSTTVCYHGTSSHQGELAWLVPVMETVQTETPDIHFEVFGDHAVNRMYRNLPRVAILHPMSWPNYLAYTGSIQRDIALAPLLPQPFNAGRGPTKFFDFTRMGAAGIYTDVAPYRGFIRNGVDGVLLPNDPVLWVQTIKELAADAPRRSRMAKAARERAVSMAWDGLEISQLA